MSAPDAPEHGAERNRRTVSTSDAPTPCVTAGPGGRGETFLLPGPSYTRQRFERYCRPCGGWVEAEGIIGAMMCPSCKGAW